MISDTFVVHLDQSALHSKPHMFSTHLSVQAGTSVPVATKSYCSFSAVTQGFLWTCLLRNLVAAVDSSFFYPG